MATAQGGASLARRFRTSSKRSETGQLIPPALEASRDVSPMRCRLPVPLGARKPSFNRIDRSKRCRMTAAPHQRSSRGGSGRLRTIYAFGLPARSATRSAASSAKLREIDAHGNLVTKFSLRVEPCAWIVTQRTTAFGAHSSPSKHLRMPNSLRTEQPARSRTSSRARETAYAGAAEHLSNHVLKCCHFPRPFRAAHRRSGRGAQ